MGHFICRYILFHYFSKNDIINLTDFCFVILFITFVPLDEAHTHSWNDGEITKAATCKEEGIKTFTCTVCGDTRTESIEKTAHTPEVMPAVAATCKTTGLTEGSKCSVCGEILVAQEVTPKIAHTWNDGEITKAATCEEEGIMAFTCTVCGDTRTESIEKTAHTPGNEKIENDNHSTCKVLGSYESVVYCSVCGGEISRETVNYTEYAAHTPGEAAKENDIPSTCKVFGSYDIVVRCTVCNDVISSEHFAYTELAAHTPGKAVKENNIPSTCKALGSYESVVYCSKCGDELSRETVNYTAYAAHSPKDAVKEDVVAATCTGTGSYDEVIYCAVCDNEISRTPKTIPVAGHKWGDWTVTKEATETEKGEKTRECSVCHEKQTEEIPTVSSNRCKWCGEDHSGSFLQKIIGFFHNIVYFFAHLFGKR